MKETGIIMSGNHPNLILDGIKTQTRRTYGLSLVNDPPQSMAGWQKVAVFQDGSVRFATPDGNGDVTLVCPYGGVGDRLWVRETWATEKRYDYLKPSEIPDTAKIYFIDIKTLRAGGYSLFTEMGKVRSAMFMCKWMSRAEPVITEVRVERLQEITPLDCLKEGINLDTDMFPTINAEDKYRCRFQSLWDSLNAKRGYPWKDNPFVWCICFRRIK